MSCVWAEGSIKRVRIANFEEGQGVLECLEKIARQEKIEAAAFNLIGTLKNAKLKYFDQKEHIYRSISKDEPLEIISCMGDISIKEDGETVIHAHAALADSKGKAYGGHLDQGSRVGAVVEAMILEFEGIKLRRVFNPKTKLYHLVPKTI